jgi:pimeloyl-ACP methyl ester carboxylesterase
MIYTTDTASINFEFIREELSATHTPLLLLHSALGSSREFDKLRLLYEDRPLIILDLPSHGQSTTTKNSLTIRDLAGYVHSLLIDHLHIPVVDIIGYSMGGYVAIEVALMASSVARSIVSHAMKFYWTDQAISEALAGLNPESIKQRSQKGYDILSAIHETNSFERTAMLASSIIESFRQQQLTAEDIERLECSLLLSVGDRDEMVPPEEVSRLYLELPKEKNYLAIHPYSPHPIAKLDLVSFTAAAREFWKTI